MTACSAPSCSKLQFARSSKTSDSYTPSRRKENPDSGAHWRAHTYAPCGATMSLRNWPGNHLTILRCRLLPANPRHRMGGSGGSPVEGQRRWQCSFENRQLNQLRLRAQHETLAGPSWVANLCRPGQNGGPRSNACDVRRSVCDRYLRSPMTYAVQCDTEAAMRYAM